jgi:hypothetical protein
MKALMLALVLLFGLFSGVCAQVSDKTKDESDIEQIVQKYFDGFKNDNIDSIRMAFHPKAKWFVITSEGELAEIKQPTVYRSLESNISRQVPKLDERVRTTITSLEIANNAASVKVDIIYPPIYQKDNNGALSPQESKFTEFLSLYKFPKEGWKIVSKISSRN